MADVAQTELLLLWIRKAATHMKSEVVRHLSTYQSYIYYITGIIYVVEGVIKLQHTRLRETRYSRSA